MPCLILGSSGYSQHIKHRWERREYVDAMQSHSSKDGDGEATQTDTRGQSYKQTASGRDKWRTQITRRGGGRVTHMESQGGPAKKPWGARGIRIGRKAERQVAKIPSRPPSYGAKGMTLMHHHHHQVRSLSTTGIYELFDVNGAAIVQTAPNKKQRNSRPGGFTSLQNSLFLQSRGSCSFWPFGRHFMIFKRVLLIDFCVSDGHVSNS